VSPPSRSRRMSPSFSVLSRSLILDPQHPPTLYVTPCCRLIPCSPLCSCLRLALIFLIFLRVLWPLMAPSILFPSHVPCINILLFTCHTPHQASIRTHPSSIHTYLYSLLSRTYSPRSVLLSSSQILQRGEGRCTLPVNIGLDFCRVFPVGRPIARLQSLSSCPFCFSASNFGLSILPPFATTSLGRIPTNFAFVPSSV
jgi:hypothetical protein